MFAVVWLHEALETLADIYVALDLNDQGRIAAAVAAPNTRLARAPLEKGESRSGPYRITFIDGLVVRFWVDESAGIVRVSAVAQFGR
jgi:hypothetical protein